MSWQTFKDNILKVANNPDGIPNIETVAKLYASEYDAAIKRGSDLQHRTKMVSGSIIPMEELFLSALRKGLTSSEPYDLVGEMGEGIKTYWRGALMSNTPIPTTPAPGATSNFQIISNIVDNEGVWTKPTTINQPSFELTPEKRVEYQEKLEVSQQKYNQAVEEKKPVEASTHLDEVNKYQSMLENNEEYRIDVSIEEEVGGKGITGMNFNASINQASTGVKTEDIVTETKWSEGKPFVSGFRAGEGAGGYGSGGFNVPYVPFPSGFPANATLGEKAVAIALYDVEQQVKEIPKGSDTGHARIIQMQKNGAGGGTGFPWCACAVTTWWTEAGAVISGHANKAYVPTWVNWAVANNRFVDKRNGANPDFVPKPGDAIIYGWGSLNNEHNGFDHIGIVWKVEGGKVYGVDGNFSAAVTTHYANPSTIRGYVLI